MDIHRYMNTSGSRAKAALKQTGFAMGTMMSAMPDPLLVKIVADAGYDFIYIDMEHSALSWESVAINCQMASALGPTPIVRLDHWNRDNVNRAFDLGAQGVLFHDVETVQQAEDIMS